MKMMLIEPYDGDETHFRAAVKENGQILARRDFAELHEAHGWQIKEGGIALVFVEVGFRTKEVQDACRRFGWVMVKGMTGGVDELFFYDTRGNFFVRSGYFGIAKEIEEATKRL